MFARLNVLVTEPIALAPQLFQMSVAADRFVLHSGCQPQPLEMLGRIRFDLLLKLFQ